MKLNLNESVANKILNTVGNIRCSVHVFFCSYGTKVRNENAERKFGTIIRNEKHTQNEMERKCTRNSVPIERKCLFQFSFSFHPINSILFSFSLTKLKNVVFYFRFRSRSRNEYRSIAKDLPELAENRRRNARVL